MLPFDIYLPQITLKDILSCRGKGELSEYEKVYRQEKTLSKESPSFWGNILIRSFVDGLLGEDLMIRDIRGWTPSSTLNLVLREDSNRPCFFIHDLFTAKPSKKTLDKTSDGLEIETASSIGIMAFFYNQIAGEDMLMFQCYDGFRGNAIIAFASGKALHDTDKRTFGNIRFYNSYNLEPENSFPLRLEVLEDTIHRLVNSFFPSVIAEKKQALCSKVDQTFYLTGQISEKVKTVKKWELQLSRFQITPTLES